MTNRRKPKVVNVSRFGDVTFEPEIRPEDKVKDVWLIYVDETNVRLERGVQYSVGPDGEVRFKFQPSDFKNLIDSQVSGLMVEFYEGDTGQEKYHVYDSPWLRHNQPLPF